MEVKNAIESLIENDLEGMRSTFNTILTTKAVEKLEERKIDIARNYFGEDKPLKV
jgi:hypothetical protein